MSNQKLKIQKRSNGQFCTAKQFADDIKENERGQVLRLPTVTHVTGETEHRLAEMRDAYPMLSLTFKVLMECKIDNINYEDSEAEPNIYVGNKMLSVNTCGYENYECIDIRLLSVIAEQQMIVDLHNKTEI